MMKKNSILVLSISLCMLACSGEDTGSVADVDGLAIEVQIENLQARSVITGNTLPDASSLAVIIKNSNSSETDYTANGTLKTFTFSSGRWNVDSPLMLKQQGKITAYYPSSATPEATRNYLNLTALRSADINGQSSTITLGGNSILLATNETDYLVGSGTDVSPTAVRSSITLRHAMAMVAIRLLKSTTYSGNAKLTQIQFSQTNSNNILTEGTVAIQSNDFIPNATSISYTRTISDYSVLAEGGKYIAFLVFPAILYEDGLVQMTLTIDGATKTILLPGNDAGTLHWKAGNCILYDVTMQGTQLKISKVTIAEWEKGSSSGNIVVQ